MTRRSPPIQPDRGPGAFTARPRPWARGTVLALSGELDFDAAGGLRAAVDAALTGPGVVVVLDCAGLEFCDSSGLNAILRAQARAAADGSRIELARPRPLVLRMLELTGATDAFPIREAVPG
ncbi:STAS domain-containing protein [Streptomyces sp. 1331.2]|uniref:STAS domain-containing protein n=1 Tax=Streptomyces sp. 1331.2 TaxID=1938835 RepID=UPI000BD790E3|nr:STAS domain-containing protein [Streptomyces sp. 1331.2]SOB88556.1 anti-sigma B factor antagonist [Streptomyces sp. 1331.2]